MHWCVFVRGEEELCSCCRVAVGVCVQAFPRGVVRWSVVCDCDNSWSFFFLFFAQMYKLSLAYNIKLVFIFKQRERRFVLDRPGGRAGMWADRHQIERLFRLSSHPLGGPTHHHLHGILLDLKKKLSSTRRHVDDKGII